VELVYAHLADYAATGDRGKLTIVGIFEAIQATAQRPIVPPPFFIVGTFRAHLPEGTEHKLEVRLVDADGKQVLNGEMPLKFFVNSRKQLEATFTIGLFGVNIPDTGDYAFHLFVDGQHKGLLPFYVSPALPV
jgi:hypothetical protein